MPSGSPASARMSAIARAVSGVCDAGFTIAVFPQASAGAIFHEAITAGKFHGVISTHTPTGSRSVTSMPGGTIGIVSPKILLAAPPQYSKTLATRSISPRAALIGLPPLRASSRARSSWRSRIMNEALVRTRPRSRALVRGHAPSSNASTATSTARWASSGPASATSAMGSAVLGSTTSNVFPSTAAIRSPPTTSSSVIRTLLVLGRDRPMIGRRHLA